MFILLGLLHGKNSSQFCLVATWHPPPQEAVLHECLRLAGRSAADIGSPSTNPPQSQGLFQDLHFSALRGSLWLSAAQQLLHQRSVRTAGSQPATSPRPKGKWVYRYVSPTFSSLPWVTTWLVSAWSLLLPLYSFQNKRTPPQKQMFPKQFPLLNSFTRRGIDYLSLGQMQGWIGARRP